MFDSEFLSNATGPLYRESLLKAVDSLLSASRQQPYSRKTTELSALLPSEVLPLHENSFDEIFHRVRPIIANSVSLSHPNTIAHLHCPPLIASLVAEVIISALNQSMDSFDQAPAATVLELAVSRWLCNEVGLPDTADAVFTAGATQSNFMGLLLARDAAIQSQWDWPVQQKGLPPDAHRLRFLCSEVAHFTVEKSASQLGLGSNSVLKVAVDDSFRMIPAALAEQLNNLRNQDLIPAAIVATAGTTDFGSIDPLPEIAALAHSDGAWLHVDAAYGSALLLSSCHRHRLQGIAQADSISMDFHKKFWQAISCGAFLLRDSAHFRKLQVHADYLNPEAHDALGVPNLVNRSLATTRRFDALKLWLSFQVLGREKFGQMIDRTIELAAHAAAMIKQNPRLELLHEPQSGCVVFRYRSAHSASDGNRLNWNLRQHLFDNGSAVIGQTSVHGRQCLKFTFMNPTISELDISALLDLITSTGRQLDLE